MKLQHAILIAVCLAFSSTALADSPENYIKYRKAMMKAIGGHMGSASQIVRGKVTLADDLKLHAQALADLNANLPRLFPEGSDFGETRAKAEIWDQPDKFEKAVADAKTATAAFADAVKTGDKKQIGSAFKGVGKSCKGCHKAFREKDE